MVIRYKGLPIEKGGAADGGAPVREARHLRPLPRPAAEVQRAVGGRALPARDDLSPGVHGAHVCRLPAGRPRDAEEAIEEMAEDLAVIETEPGHKRLIGFLKRLQKRERMLELRRTRVGGLAN